MRDLFKVAAGKIFVCLEGFRRGGAVDSGGLRWNELIWVVK